MKILFVMKEMVLVSISREIPQEIIHAKFTQRDGTKKLHAILMSSLNQAHYLNVEREDLS
jgi:hypothetical protein